MKINAKKGKKITKVTKVLESSKTEKKKEKVETEEKKETNDPFNVEIEYPPTKDDQKEMDKINQVQTLFPNKFANPKPEAKTCECGHKWLLTNIA
jgi:hypothetical protein